MIIWCYIKVRLSKLEKIIYLGQSSELPCCERTTWLGLKLPKSKHWQTSSKKMVTSVVQPQATKFCQRPGWAWKKTQALEKNAAGRHLDLGLVRPQAESPVIPCPDFWPVELWANRWVLFSFTTSVIICYVAIIQMSMMFLVWATGRMELWITKMGKTAGDGRVHISSSNKRDKGETRREMI